MNGMFLLHCGISILWTLSDCTKHHCSFLLGFKLWKVLEIKGEGGTLCWLPCKKRLPKPKLGCLDAPWQLQIQHLYCLYFEGLQIQSLISGDKAQGLLSCKQREQSCSSSEGVDEVQICIQEACWILQLGVVADVVIQHRHCGHGKHFSVGNEWSKT